MNTIKNKMKRTLLSLVTLMIAITLIQLNPNESLNIYADDKGPYYQQNINRYSEKETENQMVSTPNIHEPEVRTVEKDDYETLTLSGFREDVSKREKNIKVFVRDDEEKNLIFMDPVHELVDGEWQDIRLEFVGHDRLGNSQISTTNERVVAMSESAVKLSDDNRELVTFDVKQFSALTPTTRGFIGSKTVSTSEIIPFQTAEGITPKLNETGTSILLMTEGKEVGILSFRLRGDAFDKLAMNPDLELHTLETGYGVSVKDTKVLKPDTPFDVDLESDVTRGFDSSTVSLFGVRSGANYKSNSYNPGGSVSTDNVVIGNGDYNDGYIFCTGTETCESRNNWGIISFYNGQSLAPIIGQNRTVSDAKLVMYYNTNPSANDGEGAVYSTYMMDPSKNFDVSDPLNITYDNLQTYLNNSAIATPMGASQTATGYYGTLNFDITDIMQSWENSGTHHGILIKGESKPDGSFLEAAHYFPNHVSNIYPNDRPYIEITTIRQEPVDDNLSLDETTLNLRPFTVNSRNNNVLQFSSLGFDGISRPGSTIKVDVKDKSNQSIYTGNTLAIDGYRRFPQYSQELGYDTLADTQTYYRLTSNYQIPNLLYNTNLKMNSLYKVSYQSSQNGISSEWKQSDEFILYKVTAYDRLPRLLAFYGITNKTLFMQDNNMDDELLVEGNVLFIRNPLKNKDKIYQPATLSENDKRMIDNNLLGRNQHCVYGYEPINFNTGNFVYSNPDTGSIEYDKEVLFDRYYNSMAGGKVGLFGRNWTLSLYKELYFLENGNIELSDGTGRILTFEKLGNGYATPFDSDYTIERYEIRRETIRVDNGYYDQDEEPRQTTKEIIHYGYKIIDPMTHEVMTFNEVGNITTYERSQYEPAFTYEYKDHQLTAIVTPAGRKFIISLNEYGLIGTIKEPDGNVLNYGYDENLNLVTFSDQMGYTITYRYDTNSLLLSYTGREHDDTVIENVYDAMGRISKQTDALGQTSTFTYNLDYTDVTNYQGNVTRVYKNDKGYATRIEDEGVDDCIKVYDSKGNLIQETAEDGTTLNYEYDTSNRLIQTTNARNQTKSYTYDTNNNVVKITDFSGDVTTFTYDDKHRIISSNYPDGTSETKTYNDENQVTYERDMYGLEKYYTYANGQKVESKLSDGATAKYSYTAAGNLKSATDELGNVTTYTYDDRSQLVRIDYPHHFETFTYDGDGHKVSETDGNGNRTNYTYDGWSRIIAIETQSGTTKYTYDENGNVVRLEDAMGNVESFTYDSNDQLIESRDKLGRISTFLYDTRGNLVETVNPLGQRKTYQYDSLNNVIEETFIDQVTSYEYDSNGNRTKTIDPFGRESINIYDSTSRLIESIDVNQTHTQYEYQGLRLISETRDGLETSYRYDIKGNKVGELNPLNRLTEMLYAKNGTVIESSIGDSLTLNSSYDGERRILSKTDADGNVRTFEYDGNGNVIKETDENGNTTTTTYTHQNQVATRVSPLGYTFEYDYDVLGRKIAERQLDILNDTVIQTKYEYDAKGNMIREIDALGRVTVYEYDALDRVVSVDAYGRKTTTTYDEYGKRIKEVNYQKEITYTYDAFDRLVETTDNLGYQENLTYNDKQQLIERVDENGISESYEYNEYGYLVKAIDVRGRVSTFETNVLGETTKATDIYGNTSTYDFNELGQLVSSDAGSFELRTVFDARGHVKERVVSAFLPVVYEYDAVGNILSEATEGHESTHEYDAENRLIKSVDALGNSIENTYNIQNQVIAITYPDGTSVQHRYDLAGRKIASIDQLGFETTYEYNDFDELIKETNPLNETVTYEYDSRGNQIRKIESGNQISSSAFDERNRQVESISPNGNKTTMTYTDFDAIATQTYPNGLTRTYIYNEYQELLSEGWETQPQVRITYAYDTLGRMKSKTDELDNVTIMSYDSKGNLIIGESSGLKKTREYDEFDRLIKETDERGFSVMYSYDEMNRLSKKEDSLGAFEAYVYDALNRIIKTENALGSMTTTYDVMGRKVATTDANNATTTYEYDERGQLIKQTNAVGNFTANRYDALGRVVESTDERGFIQKRDYDAAGNIVAQEDEHGIVMRFVYDKESNLIETRYKDERVEKRNYDSMNNLVSITNADGSKDTSTYDVYGNITNESINGRKTGFAYNDRNQLIKKITDDEVISYTYDNWGQMQSSSNADGSVLIRYNNTQDIIETQDPNDKRVQYTYDIKGRQTSIVYPNGKRVNYTYDAYDRLIVVDDGKDTTTYGYDAIGNPILETTKNLKTQRTFDALGNLETQVVTQNGETLSELSYERDARSNVTVETLINEGEITKKTYLYDALNQIVEEQVMSEGVESITQLTYDFRGNRLTETKVENGKSSVTRYNHNQKQQLVSVVDESGTINLRYDDFGNVIEKRYSNGLVESYDFTSSNQLKSLTDNYGREVTYTYDASGERIGRKESIPYDYLLLKPESDLSEEVETYDIDSILDTAIAATLEATENSYYCTITKRDTTKRIVDETYVNDRTKEHTQVLNTYRAESPVEDYTYGITRLKTDTDTDTSYNIINGKFDIIGSVSANDVTWNSYALGGATLSNTTPRFGYSSENHDGSLQYLRARYYDTEVGIFLSQDTYRGSQFEGLSQNRYIYTENNSTNGIDPSGHFFNWVKDTWNSVVDTVVETVKNVGTAIGNAINTGISHLNNFGKWVGNTLAPVIKPVQDFFGAIGNAINTAVVNPLVQRAQSGVERYKALVTGDSEKQLTYQISDLISVMNELGYSSEEIEIKRLELIKKYCERFDLDVVDFTSSKSFQDKMQETINRQNEIKKADKENWLVNGVISIHDAILDGLIYVVNTAAQITMWMWNVLTKYKNEVIAAIAAIGIAVGIILFGPPAGFAFTVGGGAIMLANGLMALVPSVSLTISLELAAIVTAAVSGTLVYQMMGGPSGDSGNSNGSSSEEGTRDGQAASPYDLEPTHGQTMSNTKFNELVGEIKENGITESIKYVEHDGVKYVVDGHHRLKAAKVLGLDSVPIEKVSLPYNGYFTIEDLFWFGD